MKKMLLLREHYKPWVYFHKNTSKVICWIKYTPIRILNLFFPNTEMIKRHYSNVMTRFNNQNTGFHYEQTGGGNRYGKWVIPDECFKEFIYLNFEDTVFSCPKNYHLYLSTVYGDYMKLPPADKRENRHKISKVVL